ncbi:MAG: hypothetical protein FJX37_07590, partial [Alphaproteobacteria bacterium]|nr:hypothetical protein [Alphaproteobacteria bacterium]
MRVPTRRLRRAMILATAVFGCGVLAGAPAYASDPVATDDPLESVNRVTSEFNAALRKGILDPLVEG